MEKIKKLVLLSTFLLFPEILNAFKDIINPDVTTNRWIIESNTKYLNKASARSFKGELEAEIVVDISEQRLYLVKNKKIYYLEIYSQSNLIQLNLNMLN